MKRTRYIQSILAVVGLALVFGALQAVAQPRFAAPRGNCYLYMPGANAAPAKPLTEAEKTALNDAIQDEYKARATYEKILDTFGDVRPFVNIINAEDRHVEALVWLHERYGVPVPEDTWADKRFPYASLKRRGGGGRRRNRERRAL